MTQYTAYLRLTLLDADQEHFDSTLHRLDQRSITEMALAYVFNFTEEQAARFVNEWPEKSVLRGVAEERMMAVRVHGEQVARSRFGMYGDIVPETAETSFHVTLANIAQSRYGDDGDTIFSMDDVVYLMSIETDAAPARLDLTGMIG